MKTKFEQDLDRLEYTVFHHGYNACITDVERILSESLKAATSTEEITMLVKILTGLEAMEKVRFPQIEQQN